MCKEMKKQAQETNQTKETKIANTPKKKQNPDPKTEIKQVCTSSYLLTPSQAEPQTPPHYTSPVSIPHSPSLLCSSKASAKTSHQS